jgi:alkylated DNA nucleotide flippase Atl1
LWRDEFAPDLTEDETFDDVHRTLLHTLGNLTLTGYNSTLSNLPFSTKKSHLAASGIRMNQEIAAVDRWGRSAIEARAAALASRITSIWPAPLDVADESQLAPAWELMAKAVAEIPPGAWTTYGDLAALIGSHAVPVGMRIANHPIENGHRVMQASGTISPGFRWYEPDRQDDPVAVLKAEGVEFDDQGRANPSQRFTAEDFANLLGDEIDELPGELYIPEGQDASLRDKFVAQLTEGTSPAATRAILSLIATWTGLGGEVSYGTATQTSCFLGLRLGEPDAIWMAAIYPTGSVEIVFQWLASKPPFDDIQNRNQLRERLNQIEGIDIPTAKLALRPSIRAELLVPDDSLQQFADAGEWFLGLARGGAVGAVSEAAHG